MGVVESVIYIYRIGRAGWLSNLCFFMTDKRVEVPEDDSLTYKQRRKAQIKEEKKRTKPSRQTLAANSKGGRVKTGRPKGDAPKLTSTRLVCWLLLKANSTQYHIRCRVRQ